jgi:uncharacterized membrane protein YkvA (DUF1232 family)
MSEAFTKPFTKDEIAAMRHAFRSDEGVNEEGVRRGFWSKVMRVGRKLPFAEDLLAAYFCTLDPATPHRVKFVLLGAIAYFVLPFDAIADFLPFFGFADDAAVLTTAIAQVAGAINESHREKARDALRDKL